MHHEGIFHFCCQFLTMKSPPALCAPAVILQGARRRNNHVTVPSSARTFMRMRQTRRRTDTPPHRRTYTVTHRRTDTQTHKHTDPQIHRRTATQPHRRTATPTHRHTQTRIRVSFDIIWTIFGYHFGRHVDSIWTSLRHYST